MALAYLIDPETPKNDGAFRPLEVIAKQGTVVWAEARRAGDAVHQPLRPGDRRGDHQGAGAGLPRPRDGRLGPALPHRDPGHDPRTGRRSSGTCFRRARAAAPRPAGDGWPSAGEWQAAGGIKFGSVEVAEVRFPLFFRRHEFRPDSGGDGQYPRRPRRSRSSW